MTQTHVLHSLLKLEYEWLLNHVKQYTVHTVYKDSVIKLVHSHNALFLQLTILSFSCY